MLSIVIRKAGKDADIQRQVCIACIWETQMLASDAAVNLTYFPANRGLLPLSRALLPSSFNFLNKRGSPYFYWKRIFHSLKLSSLLLLSFNFCKFIPLFKFTASLSRLTMPSFATVSNFPLCNSHFLSYKERDDILN